MFNEIADRDKNILAGGDVMVERPGGLGGGGPGRARKAGKAGKARESWEGQERREGAEGSEGRGRGRLAGPGGPEGQGEPGEAGGRVGGGRDARRGRDVEASETRTHASCDTRKITAAGWGGSSNDTNGWLDGLDDECAHHRMVQAVRHMREWSCPTCGRRVQVAHAGELTVLNGDRAALHCSGSGVHVSGASPRTQTPPPPETIH